MLNKVYFLVISVSILTIVMIFKSTRYNSCKYLIVLENDKEIKGRNINWYQSGFVDIRKCDGTSVTCMDNFIDTIIIKK